MPNAVGNDPVVPPPRENNDGVGTSDVDIHAFMLTVQIRRGQVLEGQVKDQMADMKRRNLWLQDANAALNAIRKIRPQDKPEDEGKIYDATYTASDGTIHNAFEFLIRNNMPTGMSSEVDANLLKRCALSRAKEALDNALKAIKDTGLTGSALDNAIVAVPYYENEQGEMVLACGPGVYHLTYSGGLSSSGTLNGQINAISTGNGVSQRLLDNTVLPGVKSSIESVNNQSQLDMIRLQSLMDKRNQAFDAMSSNVSKSSKSIDIFINNLR